MRFIAERAFIHWRAGPLRLCLSALRGEAGGMPVRIALKAVMEMNPAFSYWGCVSFA